MGDYWDDYQSGPFCQHYSHPSDCDDKCTCGHTCSRHEVMGPGDRECLECPCPKFVDVA